MKLTGRTRYRSNWRGKLILQIEYSLHHVRDLNGTGYYDEWDTLHWRDAKATDLVNGAAAARDFQSLRFAADIAH